MDRTGDAGGGNQREVFSMIAFPGRYAKKAVTNCHSLLCLKFLSNFLFLIRKSSETYYIPGKLPVLFFQ